MNSDTIAAIVIAALGSSALFGFLQFLLTRKDKRATDVKEIKTNMAEIQKDVKSINTRIDEIEAQRLEDRLEDKAIETRLRILTASDEMQHDVKHSKEFFDQLNEDITEYVKYCQHNPEFKNNKAIHAIKYINDVYEKALKQNDFL